MTPGGTVVPAPQFEQSYVENILRLNLGKQGTFYMTYENNSQWNAKVFTGVVEAAGRDHIIITNGRQAAVSFLLMVNLDYVVSTSRFIINIQVLSAIRHQRLDNRSD